MTRALLTAADFKELPIPQGLVAWWFGTYTSVPAGWEIADGQVSVNDSSYTKPNLLNRYPKAVASAGETPKGTGGNVSHSHTFSHTHTANADNSLSASGGDYSNSYQQLHSHTLLSTDASLNSTNNDPIYTEGIPIVFTLKGSSSRGLLTKRDFTASVLPPWKIVAAWANSATPPAGWSKCDGSTVNGVVTPNLLGKYLRGIPNTSTEPGSTGGASTHAHSTTHTHTLSGPSGTPQGSGAGWGNADSNHTHSVTSASVSSGSANHEPPYITLQYVCFTGHGSSAPAHASATVSDADLVSALLVPRGLVMVWAGSLASKPSSWGHCDGDAFANGNPPGYTTKPSLLGRFIKHVPNATTNGGAQGGSTSHTHTGASHSHTTDGASGTGNNGTDNVSWASQSGHTHTTTGISWSSIDSQTTLPSYTEVAFIVRD